MSSGQTPEDFRRFFAEVFAELDAHPRRMILDIHGEGLTLDFRGGDPVFKISGQEEAVGHFRQRWLPEHPLPLVFNPLGVTRLGFTPASGNRVKVRKVSGAESVFELVRLRLSCLRKRLNCLW